ncbi:unnamed protein product [Musa banksii]
MATGERAPGGKISDADVAGGGGRRWDDLNRDLLVAIFGRLGVADLIAGVPFVCSSWRDAARDPLCWRELDFREWEPLSRRLGAHGDDHAHFTGILHSVIARGHQLLKSIYFPFFADDIDLLYGGGEERGCPGLHYFSLPNPEMDEEMFRKAVGKLAFLRGMAVDENLIRSEVLLHVNQCCASLKELSVFSEFVDEDMASVICKSLPSLRKLEITESVISSQAIITFIDGLKELEHFDISGYENSAITDVVLQKASRLKVFIWNSRFELGEFMDCSNCGEDWLLQRSCECMLDRKVMEWLTELS